MVRMQIQLSAKQHDYVRKLALARRLSLSEVIRRLVDESASAAAAQGDERRGAALLSTCGSFREARPSSTAREHDRVLADLYR